jgi:hypothetical protein
MRLAATLLLVALAAAPADAASRQKYDWDDLGTEFCRLTLMGDLPALRPLLSDQLAADIAAAAGSPAFPPARILFQTYSTPVPVCQAVTRNAAIVEIRRSQPGGAGWSEYLVVVPAPDGTTRIDDVLFATRRSDTLRARLSAYAGAR